MSITLYTGSSTTGELQVGGSPRLSFTPTTTTILGTIINTGLDNALAAHTNAIASININPVWTIKTGAYNLVANDAIMANTTSASFALTLPANPLANDTIRVADYGGTFSINNLVIARNGKNIIGLAQDYTCDIANETRTFQYIDVTQGWRVL